jgi:eukaryotic-like serine/threonine-protein kinase
MSSSIIGQTLLDQFRVDAFVASGGMGAVYRVWDLKRNVPLAMKVLHVELAEDPSVFKRFKREANALKKLAHPNIVPFYGIYQTMDFAFLLERFIDGPSLRDVLRQQKGKPLAMGEVLTYLKALCAALGYAHANGVVHCDVKPGNVMIDRGGNIYLTDFGVARHAESSTTTLGAAGTPAYMAPEQILGKSVTAATDIYSLGVILFEMLTGQRPFRGTESGTDKSGQTANERIRYGHLHLPPPDPCSINPAIPEKMAKTIQKALSKDPGDRYRSTQEFFASVSAAADLIAEGVASQVALPAEPTWQDYSAGQPVPAVQIPVAGGNVATKRSRGGLFAIVGTLAVGGTLVLIVGISAAYLFMGGNLPKIPIPALFPTQTPLPTLTPFPTLTPLPTYTPYPTLRPTATRRPPTRTPVIPTPTPPPSGPMLYLNNNSFCRVEPRASSGDVTTFFAGERFPIIGWNPEGWWLVQIDIPDSKYTSCWIYGNTPEGDYSSVRIYP